MFARVAGFGILVCLTVVGFASAADKAERELPKELLPRRVSIKNAKITLADALKALTEQTEIKVEAPADEDPKLTLDLDIDKLTFWEALDVLARKADLRINLHAGENIALVKGPYREVPTSYDGLFRITVKQISAVRDLEEDGQRYAVRLEVAWEPRFRGFLLETGPEGLVVKDQRGVAVEAPTGGRGQTSIDQKRSTMVDLLLPAFKRADVRLGQLKGSFAVVGAGKMETFTFDKLAKGEKKMQNGVTVEMTGFKTDEELWFLTCAVRYPADGPKFESFQSWLVANEAYLTDKKGRKLNNAGYEAGDREGTTAYVTYQFTEDEAAKIALGKPVDWKFIYSTPSNISQVPVRFEFKDILLP